MRPGVSPNEAIGNQTRDPPACSAVPQPTAPPRTSLTVGDKMYVMIVARTSVSCFLYRLP